MDQKGIPVPNTGKRKLRWKFGWWYKTPNTTQEIRYSIGMISDGLGLFIRGKRKPRNLPIIYDDKPIHRVRKNWKRFRRTQYKIRK